MTRTSIRNLWAHKRRFVGTFVAVFAAVAFLAGTLALGDTMKSGFDNLFTKANAGTDAVVRSATKVGTGVQGTRPPLPASLAQQLRDVSGVAAVAPRITGYGGIVGSNGKPIGGNGPPRNAGNWITDSRLNPYQLSEGSAPQGLNEVVINRGAAKTGNLHLGDTTTILTPSPVRVRVVGIATVGGADGIGPATYAGFSLEGAEKYIAPDGKVDQLLVAAKPGVSQTQLVDNLNRAVPRGVQAVSGQQLTREEVSDVSTTFLNVLRAFLVVFAVIAVVVATFSINNTFAVITAQRTRELALLRAVGAERRQVLGSVGIEAAAVGVGASLAGLAGGLGVAALLLGMFHAFGFPLPSGGLVFTTGTAVVAFVVGVVATLVAAASPAVRASRVSPLAALRETAAEGETVSPRRIVTGALIGAGGIALIVNGAMAGSSASLLPSGIGALLLVFATVVLGPVVARRAAAVIGWPIERLRGVAGSLARGNSMRSPRRTAGSAAALLVGVCVVTLFTVIAASLKASASDSASSALRADLVVNSGGFGRNGMSPGIANQIAAVPGVTTSTGLASGQARIAGSTERVTAVDPAKVTQVLDLGVDRGSLAQLTPNELAVSDHTASGKGWTIGTPVSITYPDGTRAQLTVGALFKTRGVVQDYVVPQSSWTQHDPQVLDSMVMVKLSPGTSVSAAQRTVRSVVAPYGRPSVLDRSGFVSQSTKPINTMLGVVYVMLVLAILIALLGIANTLALSIHERTRELGLFRAVGGTQRQVRSMVRWESTITAAFGTVGGLGLGVFLGWAMVRAVVNTQGTGQFAFPGGQLVIVLVAGAVAGLVAGIRPARRASRLDVLPALAAD